MTVKTVVDGAEGKPLADRPSPSTHGNGLLGRLGTAAARRFRLMLVLWLAVLTGLGVLAPKAMTDLAGAGLAGRRLAVGAGASACRAALRRPGASALAVVRDASGPVTVRQVGEVLGLPVEVRSKLELLRGKLNKLADRL